MVAIFLGPRRWRAWAKRRGTPTKHCETPTSRRPTPRHRRFATSARCPSLPERVAGGQAAALASRAPLHWTAERLRVVVAPRLFVFHAVRQARRSLVQDKAAPHRHGDVGGQQ